MNYLCKIYYTVPQRTCVQVEQFGAFLAICVYGVQNSFLYTLRLWRALKGGSFLHFDHECVYAKIKPFIK